MHIIFQLSSNTFHFAYILVNSNCHRNIFRFEMRHRLSYTFFNMALFLASFLRSFTSLVLSSLFLLHFMVAVVSNVKSHEKNVST